MKLKLLEESILLRMYFHQKVRKNQKMTKGFSFKTICGFLTRLLTLTRRMRHICCFLYCFSFSHFLGTSCRFQNVRISSLKAALNFRLNKTNFVVQMYQFVAVEQTSTTILRRLFQKFQKTMCVLTLKNEKESANDEKILF